MLATGYPVAISLPLQENPDLQLPYSNLLVPSINNSPKLFLQKTGFIDEVMLIDNCTPIHRAHRITSWPIPSPERRVTVIEDLLLF